MNSETSNSDISKTVDTQICQQLQQLQIPRVQESLSLIVTIAPTAACNFEIEVSY